MHKKWFSTKGIIVIRQWEWLFPTMPKTWKLQNKSKNHEGLKIEES
jgi:hypothetical protein